MAPRHISIGLRKEVPIVNIEITPVSDPLQHSTAQGRRQYISIRQAYSVPQSACGTIRTTVYRCTLTAAHTFATLIRSDSSTSLSFWIIACAARIQTQARACSVI